MTELSGTFDVARADWSKLLGETPKSIDDIDVIGLHDKTTDKKREFVAIDRVLEIIDKEIAAFRWIYNSSDFSAGLKRAKQIIANEFISDSLEGGEQE